MSIQTELTRITNAKAAIKTAIEGKGVTVPDATLLDGMASLIESIQAGGGGGDVLINGKRCLFGTVTPTDGRNSITVLTAAEIGDLFGGSFFSNYVGAWWSSALTNTGSGGAVYAIGAKNQGGTPHYMNGTTLTRSRMIGICGTNKFGAYIQTDSASSTFLAGQEYNWIFVEV